MNQKIIISGALVLLGLVGLMWWGRESQMALPSKSLTTEKSSLAASETLYDFGIISMKNGLVEHKFTVTNSTDKDIKLKTVGTSCMCTNAFIEGGASEKGPFGMPGMGYVPPANEIVGAGESRNIKVVYDPNAHGPAGVGRIDRFVDLTEENGGILRLEIKAVVTP